MENYLADAHRSTHRHRHYPRRYQLHVGQESPHALKGQKPLAQGNALGIRVAISKAPCKGKSFVIFAWGFKAFALTGRQACVHDYPGRCPGLGASALSGRVGATYKSSVIKKQLIV